MVNCKICQEKRATFGYEPRKAQWCKSCKPTDSGNVYRMLKAIVQEKEEDPEPEEKTTVEVADNEQNDEVEKETVEEPEPEPEAEEKPEETAEETEPEEEPEEDNLVFETNEEEPEETAEEPEEEPEEDKQNNTTIVS